MTDRTKPARIRTKKNKNETGAETLSHVVSLLYNILAVLGKRRGEQGGGVGGEVVGFSLALYYLCFASSQATRLAKLAAARNVEKEEVKI